MMPLIHTPHSALMTFSKNEVGTDYIVGDIHGHYDRLMSQLTETGFDFNADRLFCVGDLIDRGPDSPKMLALLSEPWFFSLLGNHEYFMLSGLKHNNSKHKMLWLQNGGEWIASSNPALWSGWFEQIAQLPIAMQLEGKDGKQYGLLHADFPSDDWADYADFNQEELETCLWSRRNFAQRATHSVAGIDYLVHGHNSTDHEVDGKSEALQLGNRLYIEPGGYKGKSFIILAI
jgi:serine/threonine protein phosphatase 1|tara:strand:- start:6890 stop:7585 length:696 start_codon:yes stop_codon:yes gene_type:complete